MLLCSVFLLVLKERYEWEIEGGEREWERDWERGSVEKRERTLIFWRSTCTCISVIFPHWTYTATYMYMYMCLPLHHMYIFVPNPRYVCVCVCVCTLQCQSSLIKKMKPWHNTYIQYNTIQLHRHYIIFLSVHPLVWAGSIFKSPLFGSHLRTCICTLTRIQSSLVYRLKQ